jgi:3-deoxy-manno-octulosonate cytidylyltransferase (CMP-KDO synthetase)
MSPLSSATPLPVTCVIPARLESTRLPAKLLRPILGVPMLVHTLDRAKEAGCFQWVICVTDHPVLAEIVRSAGHDAVLGGPARNGTERIAQSLHLLPGRLFVNLQGDEPAFPSAGLRRMATALMEDPEGAHLLVHRMPATPEALAQPQRVKVEIDARGRVADLWRQTPKRQGVSTHLQAGVYGYARPWLLQYASMPPSEAEGVLSHEMLRLPDLEVLRAHPFFGHTQSVDVESDLPLAERLVADLPLARRQPLKGELSLPA